MSNLDFNVDHFSSAGSKEADKGLLVKFFYKAKKDKEESIKEGRPIFKEVVYVDIRIVGKRAAGACRPASQDDINRFPDHYKAFIDRTESPEEMGMPLEEFAGITRSQAEELKFFNVKTVEQLAHMADTQVSQHMGLFAVRDKARIWLTAAEKQKPIMELTEKNKALEDEVETLRKSVADLMNVVEDLKPVKSIKKSANRKNRLAVSEAEKALEG